MIIEFTPPKGIEFEPKYFSYESLINDDKTGWKPFLDKSEFHLRAVKQVTVPHLKSHPITVSTYNRLQVAQRLKEADSIGFTYTNNITAPMDLATLNVYGRNNEMTKFIVAFGHLVSESSKTDEEILSFINSIQIKQFNNMSLYRELFGKEGVLQHYSDFFGKRIIGDGGVLGEDFKFEYWPRLNSQV